MRFGRVDSARELNQEVRVRISSSDGRQYQVFQRLERPLVNEQGHILNHDAILVYTLSGSNGAGSLYAQAPEMVSSGDQLLYTSNPAGDSDAFVVVYNTSAERLARRGQFSGTLAYTVRAFGSGSADTVVLNVTLESSGQLRVDVAGSRGANRVKVVTDELSIAEQVSISYEGHSGGTIRVYQEFDGFLQSDSLEAIRSEQIQYQTLGATLGSLKAPSPLDIKSARTLLYEGSAARDQFQVQYFLNATTTWVPSAGNYSVPLRYIFETAGETMTKVVMLEADINHVFQLDVQIPAGGLKFSQLMPGGPEQIQEVMLKVASNTGKPYMILQKVVSPMTSSNGYVLDANAFQVRQEVLLGDGKVGSSAFDVVKVGETPVYVSANQGRPAEVKVQYRLTPYASMQAGDYATVIQYSLSEL